MKRIMLTAALLALAAGEVQAQTPPEQPQAGRGGGFRGGGGPRGGGGERPQFNAGARPNFERPAFNGGQRPDFNGARPSFERRGFTAGQPGASAAPAAPAGGAQPSVRRYGEGGGYRGQRFGGAPAQAAPVPGATGQAQPGQAFGARQFQGQRFQNGGRYDGQRFQNGGQQSGGQFDGRRYGGGQGFQSRGYVGGQRFGGNGNAYRGARAFSYRGRSYGAFRAAPYRFPRGYSYQRYGVRSYLPLAFLSSSWFLNDFSSYYLAPPPSEQFRWVRYGPDALLVDTYTGQVVDAAYGVFDDGQGYEDNQYPDGQEEDGYGPPPPNGPY